MLWLFFPALLEKASEHDQEDLREKKALPETSYPLSPQINPIHSRKEMGKVVVSCSLFLPTNLVIWAAGGRYLVSTESSFHEPGNWVMVLEMLASSGPRLILEATSRKVSVCRATGITEWPGKTSLVDPSFFPNPFISLSFYYNILLYF